MFFFSLKESLKHKKFLEIYNKKYTFYFKGVTYQNLYQSKSEFYIHILTLLKPSLIHVHLRNDITAIQKLCIYITLYVKNLSIIYQYISLSFSNCIASIYSIKVKSFCSVTKVQLFSFQGWYKKHQLDEFT